MVASEERRLKHAIIGVGAGVLSMHRAALALPTVNLVAASDIDTIRGQERANELGCAFYADYCQLLRETQPEVVIVMTPHPFHARIAIDCLNAGAHVLVEKPMAVQVAEADEMIKVAKQNQRLLGVCFQQRWRSPIRTAHKLIQEGRLGDIQRVEMSVMWTRPASYFQQAGWRGTWKGEGGGVLMNQAVHNLDAICYLMGAPERVFAWTRTRLHHIETEDTAHASMEWSGGALGYIHISTAEADQPKERLKIAGTAGSIEISGKEMTMEVLDPELKEFIATSPKPFSAPASHAVAVELEPGEGTHESVYRAFHQSILDGDPFPIANEQGLMALELANAMIYSNYTHAEVNLPLDRQKYGELLARLQEGTLK
ncbi:MAG TPA: Gfo/Idh/MocA family oxidoreductase [Ktedonosporobacter sp.]|nr:Gfo/Idh/MocA family oxidoreductase [Ktedonosporobacter sp.]